LCLLWMIEVFACDCEYSEKEVNAKIKAIYPDFVTVRRDFVDYGFMKRTDDGAKYWRIK